MHANSDVLARLAWKPWLWPGFWNLQARPKLSMTAGFGSNFGPSCSPMEVKFSITSNILSTERHTVLQRELSAHEWECLDFIIHWPFLCILWSGVRPWKPFGRYWNTLTMLNDCQQMKMNINQWDIPLFSYQIHVMHWFVHVYAPGLCPPPGPPPHRRSHLPAHISNRQAYSPGFDTMWIRLTVCHRNHRLVVPGTIPRVSPVVWKEVGKFHFDPVLLNTFWSFIKENLEIAKQTKNRMIVTERAST